MAWKSTANYTQDTSGKQFVFSLSNNHKFVQSTITQSVYCNVGNGPTFWVDTTSTSPKNATKI